MPWVVWYENSDSNGGHPSTIGLQNQDMVFAAKAVADPSGDGGLHLQVVGLGTAGQSNVLDNSGVNGFGPCAASITAENQCSLNVSATSNLVAGSGGENPSIAAGTLVAGNKATPWISWDESTSNGGQHSVFVARLDAAGDHYDLLNNGQAILTAALTRRARTSSSPETPRTSPGTKPTAAARRSPWSAISRATRPIRHSTSIRQRRVF